MSMPRIHQIAFDSQTLPRTTGLVATGVQDWMGERGKDRGWKETIEWKRTRVIWFK